MAKFKRSFQPGGFRPEQAGDGGEARLREYSKQVIKGLTQERDAITADRNRTADVMAENYKIESGQTKANAKIEQANIQRAIEEQQTISQQALREFEVKTDASKKVYQAFADLSTTAQKKFAELEVQKLEEKGQQEKAEILSLGYNHPLVKGMAKLRQAMRVEEMQGTTELNVAYAKGEISELEYTELMKQLNSLTADGKAAILSLLGKDFASFYTQKLNTDEGREAAGDQQKTLEFGQRALEEWEKINGITGINAALKQDSGYYDKVFTTLQTAATRAGTIQTQNNKNEWLARQRSTLDELDAAQGIKHIETIWPTMVAYLGAEAAHNRLRDWFARVSPDGNVLLDLSTLTNAKIGLTKNENGEFKTYGEFWKGRIVDIQNTITDARDKITQREDRDKATRNRFIGEQLIAETEGAGFTPQERFEKYSDQIASFRRQGEAPPRSLLNAQAAAQKDVEAANAGEIARLNNLVATDNLNETTASTFEGELRRKAFAELVKTRNTEKYGLNYENIIKGLDGDARKLLKLTGDSATTSALLSLQSKIKEQWQAWYKQGLVKHQGNKDDAVTFAQNQHDLNMRTSRNDTSLYYSQPASTTDPTVVFQKLDNLRLNSARQQQDALRDIENNIIGGMNLDQLLASGAVISQREMEDASLAANAGLSIKPYVTERLRHTLKLYAGRGQKLKAVDLVNRAIQVHNQKNPGNQILGMPEDPVFEAVIDRSAETEAQIARISAEYDQQQALRDVRYFRPSMRSSAPSAPSTYASTTVPNYGSLADVVASGEGTYTSIFPSESYPDITNMSIREVMAFQKEKLRDGRKSAAIGRYQFLYPETWLSKTNLTLDDKFTPENQDLMFWSDLIKNPNRRPAVYRYLNGLSNDLDAAVNDLSKEFAAVLNTSGVGSHDTDGVNKGSVDARQALMRARQDILNNGITF
jgi:muramidase (phage lysozyme)